MTKRDVIVCMAGVVLAAVAVAGYQIGRARADGIPARPSMYYTGTLDDGGVLITAVRDITVRLYTAETGGAPLCSTNAIGVHVTAGDFRVPMDDLDSAEFCRAVRVEPASAVAWRSGSTALPIHPSDS